MLATQTPSDHRRATISDSQKESRRLASTNTEAREPFLPGNGGSLPKSNLVSELPEERSLGPAVVTLFGIQVLSISFRDLSPSSGHSAARLPWAAAEEIVPIPLVIPVTANVYFMPGLALGRVLQTFPQWTLANSEKSVLSSSPLGR